MTCDVKAKHPLADAFPPSGELNPDMPDVDRDLSQKIPDTTGEYALSKLLSKEDADRYKQNPNHPDFHRDPPLILKDGSEVLQPFAFEKAKFDDHLCPNCPLLPADVSFSQDCLDHALRIPITENNPTGCFNDFGLNTFETRLKDNRSLTIVCETEGKMLFQYL